MNSIHQEINNPSSHDKYAKEYDNQIKAFDCYIAEVLFGLSYQYITKGETLLDIGIGTGISSSLFSKAGLHISGMDGSREMLNICMMKDVTDELIEHDLLVFPWPFEQRLFDHIISCGVFHFIGNLESIFQEIFRVQKYGGIFAFTIMEEQNQQDVNGKYQMKKDGDFNIYSHNLSCIYNLLKTNKYTKEKEMVAFVGQTKFRVILARKEKS